MVIFPYVEIILCNCSYRIQASPLLLLHLLFLLSVFFNEDVQELLKKLMRMANLGATSADIISVFHSLTWICFKD
jgi:hypothetical protein